MKINLNNTTTKPLNQNRMKFILLIGSISSIVASIATAQTHQSQTCAIQAVVFFCAYCIVSEIQKLKLK